MALIKCSCGKREMNFKSLTPADLPGGWKCEECDQPKKPAESQEKSAPKKKSSKGKKGAKGKRSK